MCANFVFCSTALLNVFFTSCRGFLVESLGTFMNKIIPSANKSTLTSSFPTCIPFLPLPCFIALAKLQLHIEWGWRREQTSCLVHDFSENVWVFLLLE